MESLREKDILLFLSQLLNQETKEVLEQNPFQNLNYFLVSEEDRGLTRQRNYGISRAGKEIDVVCFLDDDTVLELDYFEQLLKTFEIHPEALGVGGYIQSAIKAKSKIPLPMTINNLCKGDIL